MGREALPKAESAPGMARPLAEAGLALLQRLCCR